jgi:hypothetical protein
MSHYRSPSIAPVAPHPGEGRDEARLVTFSIPILLWREEHTRCECVHSTNSWRLRLWVGQTMVRERAGAGIGPLFRAAQLWRETEVKFRFMARHSPARFKAARRELFTTSSSDRAPE